MVGLINSDQLNIVDREAPFFSLKFNPQEPIHMAVITAIINRFWSEESQ